MFRAQSSMILIVLLIFIIIGIGVFLLSFSQTVEQSDYFTVYAHNLLLTTLRSSTGYQNTNCQLVSDVISCAFFNPSRTCDSGETCEDVALESVERAMNSYGNISKNFRYFLIVTPVGVTPRDRDNITFGDEELLDARVTKYAANELIQRVLRAGQCETSHQPYLDCLEIERRNPDAVLTGVCADILADRATWQASLNECRDIAASGSYLLKAHLLISVK